jgi:hypothetical protein
MTLFNEQLAKKYSQRIINWVKSNSSDVSKPTMGTHNGTRKFLLMFFFIVFSESFNFIFIKALFTKINTNKIIPLVN